jgi:DNA-binding transcriptional MerR regulator
MAALHPTTYTISDLAREFDLTTRAIRFYEDMGLLQPERSGPGGRNRVYSPRDRTRLKLTLRAKRLGLSLTEAKDIIDMYDSPRDTGPQLRKFLTILARTGSSWKSRWPNCRPTWTKCGAREGSARPAGAPGQGQASKA